MSETKTTLLVFDSADVGTIAVGSVCAGHGAATGALGAAILSTGFNGIGINEAAAMGTIGNSILGSAIGGTQKETITAPTKTTAQAPSPALGANKNYEGGCGRGSG